MSEITKCYNLAETSRLMGVKVRTLRKWIHDGKLKAIKYGDGRRWYISANEIQRVTVVKNGMSEE